MYNATKGIHHTLEMFKTYVAPHMSRIPCAVDRVLEPWPVGASNVPNKGDSTCLNLPG